MHFPSEGLNKSMRGVLVLVLAGVGIVTASEQTTVPVSVKVHAAHVGTRVVYHYTFNNKGPHRVAAVWIGYNSQNDNDRNNDSFQLSELPIGWTLEGGIPAGSVTSPPGWKSEIILQEETPTHALEWGTSDNNDHADIGPGQTLTGASVTLAKRDQTYRDGHALILLSDGDPKNFTIKLEPEDITPPSLSINAKPSMLWPPNGKLVPVTVIVTADDDYDGQPEIKLESITANESLRDGDITGADFGKNDGKLNLAAKRAGDNKEGRIYTITYSAIDASGNKATASTTVTVPHDKGK